MNISEGLWKDLIEATVATWLVPFLGAGASASVLPTGSELAQHLIEHGGREYPDAFDRDLMRVAQYYQVMSKGGSDEIRAKIADLLKARRGDDLESSPHAALAQLPVPLYVTTNYDDLMEQALIAAGRDPLILYPLWNAGLGHVSDHVWGGVQVEQIEPSVTRPVVYHLHGYWDEPRSMVLTEDDYIHFLSGIHNPELLPVLCRQALSSAYLLFVGYSLRDWNIRILLKREQREGRKALAIIRPPTDEHLAEFLRRDLALRSVQILWGTAQEFTDEFMIRWQERQRPG